MRYQVASVSKPVERKLREIFKECQGGEMCLSGAIRLMLRGEYLPEATFLSEGELNTLEENGYNRYLDPAIMECAVLLVLEAPKGGQIRTRGIYEQGNLFEMQR